MSEFYLKARLLAGQNSCNRIADFPVSRVLLVCDPFIAKSGKTELITRQLEKIPAEYRVFSEVVPDPDLEVVKKGLTQAVSFRPDGVIAMGGGSAMDTAKAILYLYLGLERGKKPFFAAVPTTSGSGSEVTSFAVIIDRSSEAKYPLIRDEMVPDAVLLDPELTATVPPSVTADTGIDVFTHAMEAFVSTKANDFTDALAEKAMRTVWTDLELCCRRGDNLAARARMQNASCMAGAAFNVASLGLCHSMAHALGGMFHLPHGRCNAVLLPLVMEYNAGLLLPCRENAMLRYQDAARVLGISASTGEATVYALIRELRELMNRVGIPFRFEELGIDRKDFEEAVPFMSEKALQDRCTPTNPRKPTVREIRELYRLLETDRSF